MVVEIFRRNFLASMVPVIVNAILNEHQLVIDIVAFVNKGDFHRSRLGEKQRGKILGGWVMRKMRTIAQYSIRDPHGSDDQITEVAEPGMMPERTSTGTFNRTGGPESVKGSLRGSLRGSMLSMSTQMQNLQLQTGAQEMPGQYQHQMNFGPPAGVSEMPGQGYPPSIPERAELATDMSMHRDGSDDTPTEAPRGFQQDVDAMSYNPIGRSDVFEVDSSSNGAGLGNYQHYGSTAPLPTILRSGMHDDPNAPPEPHYTTSTTNPHSSHLEYNSFDGAGERAGQFDFGVNDTESKLDHDRWDLSGQDYGHERYEQSWRQEEQGYTGGGGLRVTNHDEDEGNGEWAKEAIMHMNFAGSGPEDLRRLER